MAAISVFLLTLSLSSFVTGQFYKEECYIQSERCVPLEMCPSKMRSIRQGYRHQICAFRGNESLVCCELRNIITLSTPTGDSDQDYDDRESVSTSNNRNPAQNSRSLSSNSHNNRISRPSSANSPNSDTRYNQVSGINTRQRTMNNNRDQNSYNNNLHTSHTVNRNTENTNNYYNQYGFTTTKPVIRQRSDKYNILDSNSVITAAPVTNSYPHNTHRRHQSTNGQNNNELRVSNPIEHSNIWQNEVTSRTSAKTTRTQVSQPTQGPLTKRDRFDGTFMRISEQKCREYSSHVSEDFAAIPLLLDPEPVYFSVAKCKYDSVPLIVGGEKAELDEFPHMAAIGYEKRTGGYAFSCGGSLISENFVLTAAHCTSSDRDDTLSSPTPKIVRLGDLNLVSDSDGAEPIEVNIKQIIKHPAYKPPKKYHDIALLKLNRNLTFSLQIRPACLWTKPNLETEHAVATGWGQIDFAENPSDDLLKVVLDIIDTTQCRKLYAHSLGRRLPQGVTADQICAGSKKGGRDTCGGDSGGPLQIFDANNKCMHRIVGITSFGLACGLEETAGVYIRVSSYVQWIESIVWP